MNIIPLMAAVASAGGFTEIEPGVEYEAGKRIGMAELGLSFEVPAAWSGGLPHGSEAVLLGSSTQAGTVIVMADTGMDAASTKAFFSQALPIDMMTLAQPTAVPTVSGNRYSQSYKLTTMQGELAGSGRGHLSDAGGAIGFFVFMADGAAAAKLADTLVASVQAHEKRKPAAVAAGGATPGAKPPTGALAQSIAGSMFYYLKVSNGFSDEESVYLCSNGTVAIDGNHSAMSTGGAGTLTYAGQDGSRGAWTVQGNQVVASLNDGGSRSWTVEQRGDGSLDIIESNWWVQTQSWCP